METPVNEIEINGIVTVPENVDPDKFWRELVVWLESKGYTFGGSIGLFDENDLPH